jgi:hypothetical protein
MRIKLNVALTVGNCEFAEIMVPQNMLSMRMADVDLPSSMAKASLLLRAGPRLRN